jgi:hypothetical protein
MQRRAVLCAILSRYCPNSSGPPFEPSNESLAACFANPAANGSAVFRYAYQSAIHRLVEGLGVHGLRAFAEHDDASLALAVTEPGGVVRPHDMKCTAETISSHNNGGVPAEAVGGHEHPAKLKGSKAFVAEDATDVLAVARLIPETKNYALLRQPGGSLLRDRRPPLALVHTRMGPPHAFRAHGKPLPFLKELGTQGCLDLDGEGNVLSTAFGEYVDGTAAVLGFRDVEDAHMIAAFSGHVSRVLQALQPQSAASSLTNDYALRICDLNAVALSVAAIVDDARSECRRSTAMPGSDDSAAIGSFGEFPILFSPLCRINLHTAHRQAKLAITAAVALDGVSEELRRDVGAINIAQAVRDARCRKAIDKLTAASSK